MRFISLCFRLCDSKDWQCLPAAACHRDFRMWADVHQSSTHSAHQQGLWDKGQTENSSEIFCCVFILAVIERQKDFFSFFSSLYSFSSPSFSSFFLCFFFSHFLPLAPHSLAVHYGGCDLQQHFVWDRHWDRKVTYGVFFLQPKGTVKGYFS